MHDIPLRRHPSPARSRAALPRRFAVAGLALACCLPAQGGEPACPLPGEPVHWIADYCMAEIGTDDEIAASDCIHRQLARKFENACQAKLHFKRMLCRLMLDQGTIQGQIERCLNDPSFQGRTVRQDGGGG